MVRANESAAKSGAGIQSARFMIDHNVRVVITGEVGPNARQILQSAGIAIRNTTARTVREAVEQFLKRRLHMKIAIATENGEVCGHFGHCPEYTLYTVEDTEIRGKEVIPNPGHKPNFLPGYLHQFGVDVIIAGGMGPKGANALCRSRHRCHTWRRGDHRRDH